MTTIQPAKSLPSAPKPRPVGESFHGDVLAAAHQASQSASCEKAAELQALLNMADKHLLTLHYLLGSATTSGTTLLPLLHKECLQAVAVLGALTGNRELKQTIANQAATPPEVLRWLAQDKASEVRRAVARNANTPHDVLWLMADDAQLRLAVAANPGAPAELLTYLAGNWDPDVRRRVAWHPNTPLEVQAQLRQELFPQRKLQKASL